MSAPAEPIRLNPKPNHTVAMVLLALVSVALAWTLDENIYRLCRTYLEKAFNSTGEINQILLSLAMFGQTLGITVTICLMLMLDSRSCKQSTFFDRTDRITQVNHDGSCTSLEPPRVSERRRWRHLVFASLLLGFIGVSSLGLKMAFGRARPLAADGKTIIHSSQPQFRRSINYSFPSGHTMTAVAIAVLLATMFPQVRGFVIVLAIGVALNRIISGRHFLSDVVAGAWFGYWLSRAMMHQMQVWRFSNWLAGQIMRSNANLARWFGWRTPKWSIRRLLTSPWSMLTVSLLLHLAGNAATPLWDRDEPRFATATREMMQRGDWVLPTFNGDIRPDKPIMIYWLMGIWYRLLGDHEFAARLTSSLAGALVPLVVYRLGRLMYQPKVGCLAGWIMALSPMLVIESKLATVDALLLLCIVSAMLFLWEHLSKLAPLSDSLDDQAGAGESSSRTNSVTNVLRQPILWFWVSMALGVLVKGPVAVAIPLVTVVGYAMATRSIQPMLSLRWGLGAIVMTLLIAPWVIAVHVQSNGEFLQLALGRHVIERSLTPMENHAGFPGFYLVSLLGLMAPWSWLIGQATRLHGRASLGDRRTQFLLAWSIGTLVLFELVRTKLVHYYLPAYPAIALFIASGFLLRRDRFPTLASRVNPWAGWLSVGIGSLLLLAAGAVAVLATKGGDGPLMLAVGMIVLVLGLGLLASGLAWRRRRLLHALLPLGVAWATALLLVSTQVLPIVGKSRVIHHVVTRLNQHHEQYPIGFWLYRDPSMVYNLKTTIQVLDPLQMSGELPDINAFARKTKGFICPVTSEQLKVLTEHPTLAVTTLDSVVAPETLPGLHNKPIHVALIKPRQEGPSSFQTEKIASQPRRTIR